MKDGITKQQSKLLQGLAILMMLYHHLFSTPEALGVEYISLLRIGEINIELHMAWFFKLCVAIYAFVSGYGLCRSFALIKMDRPGLTLIRCLGLEYRLVLKQLLGLYIQYWLVFVIFVPIGFVFFNKPFELREFVLNLLGVSSTYNGAWWYMLFYLKALITLPLVDCLFTLFKDRFSRIFKLLLYVLLFGGIILLYFGDKDIFSYCLEFFQPAFYLCLLVGYLLSRFKIYEFAYKLIPQKLLYFLGILGFILVIAARVKIAKDASSAGLDFVFVPVFAYGFCVIMELLPKCARVFGFLGRYSTLMWLTHVFFYDHYAKNLVMASHLSTLIYLTLLTLSLLSAMLLGFLLKKLYSVFKISKIC